jgi:predicted RNA binding protein YcfA (HicA-like mRNA interferase family)
MDYQVGDELEMNGYTVKRITPSSVTVVDKRRGGKVTVPFLAE